MFREELQSAYRKRHSAESALFKVQSDILEFLHQGYVSVFVLLDMYAAFDTVDLQTLLECLYHHFGGKV